MMLHGLGVSVIPISKTLFYFAEIGSTSHYSIFIDTETEVNCFSVHTCICRHVWINFNHNLYSQLVMAVGLVVLL